MGADEEGFGPSGKMCYHLNHELGIPMAEIARHIGVCASSVVKSIQKIKSRGQK